MTDSITPDGMSATQWTTEMRTTAISEILAVVNAMEAFLNNQQTAEETARTIQNIYIPVTRSGRYINKFRALWSLLSAAAGSLDVRHSEQVASLIVAISQLPDTAATGGPHSWHDMGEWGWIFHEHAIDLQMDSEEQREAHAAPIRRATCVAASILARLGSGTYNSCGGMPRTASICLEDCLEHDGIETWRTGAYLAPAVMWILRAGKQLHELSVQDRSESYQQILLRRGWGTKTFCEERWMFWKQRFQELADAAELDEEQRDFAAQAAQEMTRLETSGNSNETAR